MDERAAVYQLGERVRYYVAAFLWPVAVTWERKEDGQEER